MKYLALYSDEISMQEVSDCIDNKEEFTIVDDVAQLLEKVKEGIKDSNYYKMIFMYPSKESKICYEAIKKIRKLEAELESHIKIVIFIDSKTGVHLLQKLSSGGEIYIYKKVIKRKILEVIEE